MQVPGLLKISRHSETAVSQPRDDFSVTDPREENFTLPFKYIIRADIRYYKDKNVQPLPSVNQYI